MFATLRLCPQTDSMRVERTHGPMESLGHQRVSCNNCRTKKLRCGLEKGGCERCRSKRIECVYPPASERKRQHQSGKRTSEKKSADVLHLPASTSTLTPPPTAPRPGSAGPQGLLASNDLPDTSPLQDFTMEDAHFVSDTSISDFVDMIPNGFDIEDMVSLDRFPGPFTSSSHSGEGPPPSRDSQLQFNDIGVHSPSESDCILPSVLSTNEAMPLSPRGPLNLSEVVGRAQLELCESHQQGFSEARNLISSSGGTTIPSTISHCHCLSRAFSLLEDIESMLRQKKPNAIDAILSVQKRALAHGGRMIECEQCTTLSASMFLLSLLSEKLVILFRKIASSCSTDQQADQNLESTVWSPNPNNGQKKICLGEFEMESVNEWGPVANVLLFMQSKRLLWMLGRLKSLAVKSGWQTHLLIVLEADKHMNSLLRSISADKNMFGTNNNDA